MFKNWVRSRLFSYSGISYNRLLFNFCKEYTDYFLGDNNPDPETNGEYRFVADLLKKDIKTVFDIGANVGNYTEFILKQKKVKVYCFEPSEEPFGKLEKRFPEGVEFINKAVSSKVGTLPFYHHQDYDAFDSVYEIPRDQKHKLVKTTVKATTIDEYSLKNNIKYIDLIKIDTEGHEYSVLMGAEKMFGNSAIGAVQFEFGKGMIYARTFLKDFYEFFNKYGFELFKINSQGLQKIIYSPESEKFSYANYAAIKK
jgi:FkbM family methyltransferase